MILDLRFQDHAEDRIIILFHSLVGTIEAGEDCHLGWRPSSIQFVSRLPLLMEVLKVSHHLRRLPLRMAVLRYLFDETATYVGGPQGRSSNFGILIISVIEMKVYWEEEAVDRKRKDSKGIIGTDDAGCAGGLL